MFAQAKKIDIAVYSFTAANWTLKFLKGKKVRIILDAGSRTEDDTRRVSGVKRILQTVAEVKTMRDLHMKVFIADSNKCVLGSMNLSKKSLYSSHEAGIYLDSKDFIFKVQEHFEILWKGAK